MIRIFQAASAANKFSLSTIRNLLVVGVSSSLIAGCSIGTALNKDCDTCRAQPSLTSFEPNSSDNSSRNQKGATGTASFYADGFHGRKTASGESHDSDSLVAAHRTLPFGTKVKLTNLANKKSVVVTINDRGPHIKNRLVDISQAAAERLEMIDQGTAEVALEVVSQ